MQKELRVIEGQLVPVTLCPPGKAKNYCRSLIIEELTHLQHVDIRYDQAMEEYRTKYLTELILD